MGHIKMTEKEFHKLRRRDLLELLVAQGKENIQIQEELNKTSEELAQAQEVNERLKARLNEKDAQMEETSKRLKAKLDEKDAQMEETSGRLKAKLDEKDIQIHETTEHLKAKLDEKDALIEKLKGRLDHKDAQIKTLRRRIEEWRSSKRIELEEAGSIAEAALRLNGIFEVAQQAADQYLYNIKLKRRVRGKRGSKQLEDGRSEDQRSGEGSYE